MKDYLKIKQDAQNAVKKRNAIIRQRYAIAERNGWSKTRMGELKAEIMRTYALSSTQLWRIVNEGRKSVTCPLCKGWGVIFSAFRLETRNEVPVSRDDYMLLPETPEQAKALGMEYCRGSEVGCPECEGEGKVYKSR